MARNRLNDSWASQLPESPHDALPRSPASPTSQAWPAGLFGRSERSGGPFRHRPRRYGFRSPHCVRARRGRYLPQYAKRACRIARPRRQERMPQHHQFRRGGRARSAFASGKLGCRVLDHRRAAESAHRSCWSETILKMIPGAEHRPIAGVDYAVAAPEAKRRMHVETGAATVDMESHLVARLASTHGLSFAAIRVVIDPAHRVVPGAALAGMRPDGGTSITAVHARADRGAVSIVRLASRRL